MVSGANRNTASCQLAFEDKSDGSSSISRFDILWFRCHESSPVGVLQWPTTRLQYRPQVLGPTIEGDYYCPHYCPHYSGASLGLEIGCSARPSRKRPEGFAPVKDSPAPLPQPSDGKEQQQPSPGMRGFPSVAGVDHGVEGAREQPRGVQAFIGS